jgi:hypothetical protein
MMSRLWIVLVLRNHEPVGIFDGASKHADGPRQPHSGGLDLRHTR